jgi:hypothetical protein
MWLGTKRQQKLPHCTHRLKRVENLVAFSTIYWSARRTLPTRSAARNGDGCYIFKSECT